VAIDPLPVSAQGRTAPVNQHAIVKQNEITPLNKDNTRLVAEVGTAARQLREHPTYAIDLLGKIFEFGVQPFTDRDEAWGQSMLGQYSSGWPRRPRPAFAIRWPVTPWCGRAGMSIG
jgi:hypothetical protein